MAEDSMLPPETFHRPYHDDSYADYYEELYFGPMRRAGEPSLWKRSDQSGYHAYRLQWDGGRYIWGPVVIRLEIQRDGHGIAFVKIWKNSPDEDDRRLQEDYTQTISPRSVRKFLRQLDRARFWELRTEDDKRGLDGETWNLEGVKNGKFHFVTRWVPDEFAFVGIGFVLLRICKVPNRYLSNPYLAWPGEHLINMASAVFMWWYKLKTGKSPD